MLSYEELEILINSIKEKLDETTSALVSEDLLNIISNYKLGIDKIAELSSDIEKLQADKDELLKVNGRLFQKVGFDKEVEEEKIEEPATEEMRVEDVIDEKGELI
jgi:negative regulator of genetic competence, sporulation and motility